MPRTPSRKSGPRQTELDQQIEALIAAVGGGHHPDLVADLVRTALKLLRDVKHRGDMKIVQTALRELRYAFKVFEPYAGRRKVTIFGSARLQPDRPEYRQAVEFGRQMAAAGFMVITGAGPGIMQAGHEGAGPEMSFGVNIRLPWEQAANPVIERDQKLITFKYFFTRKLTFIRHSDALALFPGGFGTLDEGYEALTLMQTGKSQLMPLVLIDKPGGTFWKTWHQHIRDHLLRNELISPEDLNLYQITDRPEQAVKWITRFYRNYHSSRFVKDQLVIRLQHAPSATALAALNEDFAEMMPEGPARVIEATPEEREDEDFPELPRVALGFDRKSYGRLREFIDRLNAL
ncbi:MAG: LOG family protein [Verrucomicrobia bacterium]|nr:LOG family protein [Verrucomicrobiota bacterium]